MTEPDAAPATILIVDDEISNRKLLEVLLRPEGYLTRSATTGAQALTSIAERAPDLILLDINFLTKPVDRAELWLRQCPHTGPTGPDWESKRRGPRSSVATASFTTRKLPLPASSCSGNRAT
jgi:Response regulator receiver domain